MYSTHYVKLYPQNGDRIATIDSVTSVHPMYKNVIQLFVLVICIRSNRLPIADAARRFGLTVSLKKTEVMLQSYPTNQSATATVMAGDTVGSRAYKIICHLNCRKVPSLNLSRESTVCLTSPIPGRPIPCIKALNSVKSRYTAANCPQLTHNMAVHDVLLISK